MDKAMQQLGIAVALTVLYMRWVANHPGHDNRLRRDNWMRSNACPLLLWQEACGKR